MIDAIDDKAIKEKRPFSLFTHWTNEGLKQQRAELTETYSKAKNLLYAPRSASHFYPPQEWKEAMDSYPDNFGFTQFLTDNLKDCAKLDEETFRNLIKQFNKVFAEKDIQICIATIDDVFTIIDPAQEDLKVGNIKNAGDLLIINASDEFGALIDIPGFDSHNEKKDGMLLNYKTRNSKPADRSTIIVLEKKRLIQSAPSTLIRLAHELGHFDEIINGKTFQHKPEDGDAQIECHPDTERQSALCALKTAEYLYENNLADAWATQKTTEQAALYNWVTFGDTSGTKS